MGEYYVQRRIPAPRTKEDATEGQEVWGPYPSAKVAQANLVRVVYEEGEYFLAGDERYGVVLEPGERPHGEVLKELARKAEDTGAMEVRSNNGGVLWEVYEERK
jgi:hypothetical protein